VGPSVSDGRVWDQTTWSCFGPMAEVVSVQETAGRNPSGEFWEDERKRIVGKVSKAGMFVIRTRSGSLTWEESGGRPVYCPGGGRHRDGVIPEQALVWNAGT